MEDVALNSQPLPSFITCRFCGVDKKELYKCPRCEIHYCSIKCYRNEIHAACSEGFYKECVKNELKGKVCTTGNSEQDTFEEHMQKFFNGELDELPGDVYDHKDDGEPLDSDDEANDEDEYMKKVLQSTIDDYALEESEIERRLTGLGVGSDVEQLMSKLTDEERTAFAQLAEQIHLDETGLEDSCFRSKS